MEVFAGDGLMAASPQLAQEVRSSYVGAPQAAQTAVMFYSSQLTICPLIGQYE
jgi:hypothetical protein